MSRTSKGWAGLGDAAVVAAASHGWGLLASLVVICVITNLAAYLLIFRIQKERGFYSIRVPFLSITRKPEGES